MADWYEIKSIELEDYNGEKQTCPVAMMLPLFKRTESRAPRYIEDKWLKWCRDIYRREWVKIKLIIKYI